MDTVLSTLKRLLCMRQKSQQIHPPSLLEDGCCADGTLDLEMQPLFCDEPADTPTTTPPVPLEPELGPGDEEAQYLAQPETWDTTDAVCVQDYYCTPVMFQALEPAASRPHVKLRKRATRCFAYLGICGWNPGKQHTT